MLALALGLALGAGPVVGRSDASRGAREDRLAAQADRLQDQVAALERQGRTDARVWPPSAAGSPTAGWTATASLLVAYAGRRPTRWSAGPGPPCSAPAPASPAS